MDVMEAIKLLDDYASKVDTEEFDVAVMLFGIDQHELTLAVIESGVADAHLAFSASSAEHTVVDALIHGICIGGLMARDNFMKEVH